MINPASSNVNLFLSNTVYDNRSMANDIIISDFVNHPTISAGTEGNISHRIIIAKTAGIEYFPTLRILSNSIKAMVAIKYTKMVNVSPPI